MYAFEQIEVIAINKLPLFNHPNMISGQLSNIRLSYLIITYALAQIEVLLLDKLQLFNHSNMISC
jgi:hypothetical protein